MKKIVRRSRNTENEKEILNEIELLKKIDHPNIVKIFEFYVTKQAYFLITEICSGGELFDQIMEKGPFNEEFSAYILFQVFSAVYNCHIQNILHRDLKPENILIDRIEEDGYLSIKIIDFGTAKVFEHNKAEQKVMGSAYYIAPEVLEKSYDEKCDLWSCGVIMYILLTGKPPFGGSDDEIMKKILKGVYDEKDLFRHTSEARDLIRKLLNRNPKTRISAEDALKHPWFIKCKTRSKIFALKEGMLKRVINKLKNFRYQNKFQETALTHLIHNSLHLDEVRDLYKVFSLIDTNSDGCITKEELSYAIKNLPNSKLSPTEINNEVDKIFEQIDNDGNNTIQYEEFIRACIGKEDLLSEKILKFTFNFFDKDGSGEISIDEMKQIFGGVQNDLLEVLIKEVDIDGNGQISFDEFTQMMKSILGKK